MNFIPDGYRAFIFKERASRTFGVRFKEFPGIITYGKTFEHAVKMAHEALEAELETDFDRAQPLPVSRRSRPKRGEKIVFVAIRPEIKTAYLIRAWREHSGLTQKQLAERIGISWQAYQRMERPGMSNLTVHTLQRIAQALNKRLVLDVQDARAA